MQRHNGYSALELVSTLAIIGVVLYSGISFYQYMLGKTLADQMAHQAYDYSQAVKRYITTHQTVLIQGLSTENGLTNRRIATLTPQLLVKEGFLPSFMPNKLKQIPCSIVYWDNNQLQSFIYYRSDISDLTLNSHEAYDGLNHIGSMLGLYQDGMVTGSGGDWSLDQTFTHDMFITQGNMQLLSNANPDDYHCMGGSIANNSYVVNVTTELQLPNKLAIDDTIHLYPDVLHDVMTDTTHANLMNDDLNMDYRKTAANGKELRTQSNLVFQLNPNCQLDPRDESTMLPSARSDKGCQDRQLAIEPISTSDGLVMTITGFRQAAYQPPPDQQSENNNLPEYVGELRASSLQATTKIAIGTECTVAELGKMAQQAISNDPNDVNNLYISQVQCIVSPLCPGYKLGDLQNSTPCYQALNAVSIEYTGGLSGGQNFVCPNGMLALIPSTEFVPGLHPDIVSWIPQPPDPPGPLGSCHWYDWSNIDRVKTSFNCDGQLVPGACHGFNISTRFEAWGQGAFGENCKDRGMSQGGNYHVTCTNDITRITIPIMGDVK